MRHAPWAQALALLLMACGGGGATAGDDPQSGCERRIIALAERLTLHQQHRDPRAAPTDIPLVVADSLAAPPRGQPLLAIGEGEVRLDGRGLGQLEPLDAVATVLARELRLRASMPSATSGSLRVSLWASPDVPVRTLGRLLAFDELTLDLLARDPELSAPSGEAWEELTAALAEHPGDPVERSEILRARWALGARDCAPVADWMPRASTPGDARALAPLANGLRACACRGLDELERVAVAAVRPAAGLLGAVPRPLKFGVPTDPMATTVRIEEGSASTLPAAVARADGEGPVWIEAL